MRSNNKWDKRDKKRNKKKFGMREHGKGLKHIMNMEEQQLRPIEPKVTRFKCEGKTMIVVKRAFKGDKWTAEQDTGDGSKPHTRADFSTKYIQKYRVQDKVVDRDGVK